jgi:hypothetical protein
MKQATRWAQAFMVAALAGLVGSTWGKAAANASTDWPVECVGYYTMALPGPVEYGLVPLPIATRLGDNSFYLEHPEESAWNTLIRFERGVEFTGSNMVHGRRSASDVYISAPATVADLKKLLEAKNSERQRVKDELLYQANRLADPDFAKDLDPTGSLRKRDLESATQVQFFQPLPNRDAFYWREPESLDWAVLVNGHIVITGTPVATPPEAALDEFLSHYQPRALFEMPKGPGACVPYATITGETQPVHVALTLRLQDRPDVMVFLDAVDATAGVIDGRHFVANSAYHYFAGAKDIKAADGPLMPYRSITVDGHEGGGAFVTIVREDDPYAKPAAKSSATKPPEPDWGYLAYIPGQPGLKPGQSFNLIFKVERMSKNAKQPMTEKAFRELVKAIAAGIKRRPGGWVVK